jgi:SAM-dependent methyltransferase
MTVAPRQGAAPAVSAADAQTADASADPGDYGRRWSADYDVLHAHPPAVTEAAVRGLSRLAGDRPILEVAAGTGRVAVPLARRGHAVTATDASPEMLAQLTAKDYERRVRVAVDVLPGISGEERYGVVALLNNSIWVMTSAEAQRAFLRNARERLQEGGVVVVEIAVPDPSRWVAPRTFEERGGVTMTLTSTYSVATQRVRHTFTLPDEEREVLLRYVTPNELLLMAEVEGLEVAATWSGWDGEPFGEDSRMLIAVLRARAG